MARGKAKKLVNRILILTIVALVVFVGMALFRVGAPPSVRIETALPGIGKHTPVTVRVEAPGRGLADVKVEMVQGDRKVTLEEKAHVPRPFWDFWGPRTKSDVLEVVAGRETFEGLREGDATIRVTADRAGTWLRYPDPVVSEKVLEVRLRPPSLQVLSTGINVTQGGSEVVVYRVGETSILDGVRAGDRFFRGYALPGGQPGDRFALFAVPYDLDDAARVRLVAADDVENEAEASIVNQLKRRPPKKATLAVPDNFMQRVVPAILSNTPELEDRGDLLGNYLQINNDLRRANGATLQELSGRSAETFYWSQPFLQMPNTQVMAGFAERRTYTYDGRPVDEQDHLGIDLASTRQDPVPAANDGEVVLARYLGIYGNAVVIDHGYGLMTLYGHLSSINVAEGQRVTRGEEVGRSGDTGLAGGDHLHFAVLLQGLPVRPIEWWDRRWIRDHVDAKLGDALPFEP
jgi:murein DD-endopeptidase MepM/ murein hydrolase activator NlpD